MGLTKHDFWPIFTDGWETLSGYLVSSKDLVAALEALSNHPLSKHLDLVNAKDELDIQNFLDERMLDLSIPVPLRMIYVKRRQNNVRGLPEPLPPGYYAILLVNDWSVCSRIAQYLHPNGPASQITLEINYGCHLSLGAALFIWLTLAAILAGVLYGQICV